MALLAPSLALNVVTSLLMISKPFSQSYGQRFYVYDTILLGNVPQLPASAVVPTVVSIELYTYLYSVELIVSGQWLRDSGYSHIVSTQYV